MKVDTMGPWSFALNSPPFPHFHSQSLSVDFLSQFEVMRLSEQDIEQVIPLLLPVSGWFGPLVHPPLSFCFPFTGLPTYLRGFLLGSLPFVWPPLSRFVSVYPSSLYCILLPS